MAAARLDIPAIFCNAGPMLPACYKGKHYDGNIVTEAVGWKERGEIDEAEFRRIENLAEPGCGSCAMLGTANTMGCMAEALGMSLPGSATIPAVYAQRMQIAYETGRTAVSLVERGLTEVHFLTRSLAAKVRRSMADNASISDFSRTDTYSFNFGSVPEGRMMILASPLS